MARGRSLKELTGINISASTSVLSNPNVTSVEVSQRAFYDPTLAERTSSYSHSIGAAGGHLTAQMSINMTPGEAIKWIDYGLGRTITVYNEVGIVIWQGFINQMDLTVGGLSTSVGPLNQMTNMATMSFTTIRYATNPPVGGQQRIIGRDKSNPSDLGDAQLRVDESLATFGTWETNISAGQDTQDLALARASKYVNSHGWPSRSKRLQLGSASEASLTISCLGMSRLLSRYMYADYSTGTLNPHQIISNVLAGDPDSISWNTDNVDTSLTSLDIPRYEDGKRSAETIIESATAIGDGTGNRYVFGVLNDFKAYYNQIPTTAEYRHFIDEIGQPILERNKALRPWNIVPNKWVEVKGLSLKPVESLEKDFNAIFIEQVNYTAPYGLSLDGGISDSVDELLNAQGLGGTSN